MDRRNTPRMPSLIALKAFDALVRQGNVGRAAQELHVTHGAISHQIKKLESELGTALIERGIKGVRLTSAGHQLSQKLSNAFEQLRDIHLIHSSSQPASELRIACAPALLARITPLLRRFQRNYQKMTLHLLPISSDLRLADLVISFGDIHLEGQRFAALSDIHYFPVCSPRLLNAKEHLRKPRDLMHQVLLHEDDGSDWNRYFLAAGVQGLQVRQNVFLPDAYQTIRAAVAGGGITISDHILAGEELAQGHLVRLFDVEFPAPHPYFLIIPFHGQQSLAREFADWVLHELDSIPNLETSLKI